MLAEYYRCFCPVHSLHFTITPRSFGTTMDVDHDSAWTGRP